MIASLSLFMTDSTCRLPRYIEQNQAVQSISIPIHTPTSTRFNNSDRYSLEKLKLNKRKLSSFMDLQSNWNGYNGKPIDKNVIETVEGIILNLDFQPQIFPTGRGTIQIESYKDDNNLIEIEISKDSNFLYQVDNGEEIEKDVNIKEIKNIITLFYA